MVFSPWTVSCHRGLVGVLAIGPAARANPGGCSKKEAKIRRRHRQIERFAEFGGKAT